MPISKKDGWAVYILRCSDRSLYTGITTDLTRRVNEHNSRTLGARYTRARRPVILVYAEFVANRSLAAKREYKIKQLTRLEKESLISSCRNLILEEKIEL